MSSSKHVLVVALIGGVGSGKSSVAAEFSRKRPAAIIDADRIGHQVLNQPDLQDRLRKRFGDSVFDFQGQIDRKALGALVFGPTAEHREARRDLEAIVHPAIRHSIEEHISAARTQGTVSVILLDAAVLLEAGWQDLCDAVVFIETPQSAREERVRSGRGWSPATLQTREASQWSLARKRRAADFTLDNSGSLEDSARQLAAFVSQL